MNVNIKRWLTSIILVGYKTVLSFSLHIWLIFPIKMTKLIPVEKKMKSDYSNPLVFNVL